MQRKSERFAAIALPHLDAAYNLARWLTRNDADALDVVQESYLRAVTYVDSYRGENGRAWLLTIVRSTCYRWLERNQPSAIAASSGEVEAKATAAAAAIAGTASSPESLVARQCDAALLNGSIAELPLLFREVLVLREIEELPYGDIGEVLGVPIGSVMSRLACARAALKEVWRRRTMRGPSDGL